MAGFGKPVPDLYAIAERIQREDRRYRKVYFEERTRPEGALKFETEGSAHVLVWPLKRGRDFVYVVEFTWSYRTQWDETESAEVEMGEYKTPRKAVEKAFELALWTDADIRDAFER